MTPSVVSVPDLWLFVQEAHAVPARQAASELDLARAVEAGLPIRVLRRLIAVHVIEAADISRILPKRTYERRKASATRLTTDQSDRLVRVVQLTLAAAGALGDMERGKRWLRTSNPAMRSRRPLDLARTSVGTKVVGEILGRIDHGIGF